MPITATTFSQSTTIPREPSLSSSFSCSQRLEGMKAIILQCAEIKKLWEEAKAGGDFTIECENPDQDHTFLDLLSVSRKIVISDGDNGAIGAQILVGLNMLNHSKEISSVIEDKCQMPAEDFVKELARIQYQAGLKTREISSVCAETQNDVSAHSFDRFWAGFKDSLISELARNDWHHDCAPDQYGAWVAQKLINYTKEIAENLELVSKSMNKIGEAVKTSKQSFEAFKEAVEETNKEDL